MHGSYRRRPRNIKLRPTVAKILLGNSKNNTQLYNKMTNPIKTSIKTGELFIFRGVILSFIVLYTLNSCWLYYTTYIHPTALWEFEEPKILFFTHGVLSSILLICFAKNIRSRKTWELTLFASTAMVVLMIISTIYIPYYQNWIGMLLYPLVSASSLIFIMKKSVLQANKITSVWKQVAKHIGLSLLLALLIYYLVP